GAMMLRGNQDRRLHALPGSGRGETPEHLGGNPKMLIHATGTRTREGARRRERGGRARFAYAIAALAGLALVAAPNEAAAQGLTFNSGQSIAPAFEGWVRNDDGTFSLVFGYMNRNWEETPTIPVGEDNHFSPGPADRGQPTH